MPTTLMPKVLRPDVMLYLAATYVLGAYRGRSSGGQLEDLPSPLRLHAALLAAAGSGPTAQEVEGRLVPRLEDVALLEWLEEHSPDWIWCPSVAAERSDVIHYRRSGTLDRGRYRQPKSRLLEQPAALDGPVIWGWEECPPEHLRTLHELLAEVPYLGSAESPVVLSVLDEAPTAPPMVRFQADPFKARPGRRTFQVARPGRTRALIAAYVKQLELPPARTDKPSTSEDEVIQVMPTVGLGSADYAYETENVDLPWTRVCVMQYAAKTAAPEDPVRAAVALHRALIAKLGSDGSDVDPWITGRYAEGVPRPANRIAIHCIPRTDEANVQWLPHADGAFLILIPRDVPSSTYEALSLAIGRLKKVWTDRQSGDLRIVHRTELSANHFWAPAKPGVRRTWVTWPAAVADRRARSLEKIVRTSLGMVWRDLGEDVDDFELLAGRSLASRDTRRLVHRMNPEALRLAYQAHLDLSGIVGDTALVALGQSRHLGGGLMVPVDEEEASC